MVAVDWEVFFPTYLFRIPTLGYPTVVSWITPLQEVSCAFITLGRLPAKPWPLADHNPPCSSSRSVCSPKGQWQE